jgi:CubicO group peptidase (beta-lactamase class C family)
MESSSAVDWCGRISAPYRKRHGGAVAAFVTPEGVFFQTYGGLSRDQPVPPDENTLFEIGSITKVFTAILLAKLSLDGRINPDAPVRDHLPGFSNLPDWITPRALSAHASGLPRIPDGIKIADMSNPYRMISEEMLKAWFEKAKPFQKPEPGTFAYSNLGVGLLGLALGKAHETDYRTALLSEVLGPLGLEDTRIDLAADQAQRLAPPHKSFGRSAPPWDFDALAGCGALKSTARDLSAFSQAVLAAPRGEGPLADAIRLTFEIQTPGRKDFVPDACLGWQRLKERASGTGIYQHDGGTGGSSSTLFVCPDARFALLALANVSHGIIPTIKLVTSNPAGLMGGIIASRQ